MIACASRPSEALNARWDEIDLAKKLWTVPKERAKTEKDHVVPLSHLAIEVLARQAQVRTGEAVFPGRSGSPVGYSSFARAPMEAGLDTGSPHSWRSIFRDWAGDIGRVDRDLAEAALAHSLGAVEASYRRMTAIGHRVPIMQAYANWLTSKGADKVVPLKGRA
jgi:integrase